MIRVECLISHQSLKGQALDQLRHTHNFAALAGEQFEPDKVAKGIREGKNFGPFSAIAGNRLPGNGQPTF